MSLQCGEVRCIRYLLNPMNNFIICEVSISGRINHSLFVSILGIGTENCKEHRWNKWEKETSPADVMD